MTGSLRIDGPLAEEIDTLVRNFVQQNVFRGAVTVIGMSRSASNGKPCYDVAYTGVLEILARETK
jgi:hypothetical protein